MKRLTILALAGLLAFGSAVFAEGYVPSNMNIDGSCDWYFKEYSESLGDIIRTIPIADPGANNAYTGIAVVGDTLFLVKNVLGPQCYFVKLNLANGDTIGVVRLAFDGLCMGAEYDGSGIWIAQYSASNSNTIYKVGLDGSVITQLSPQLENYSPRALAVEGDYIWVGANRAQNDTKLFKITNTGTVVENYNTGNFVGWYMDGALNSEARSGSNVYVVDNLGMLIKRITVAGGSINVTEQVYSPVIANDVCEGLAHDGTHFWHSAAHSLQGLVWCLDDGVLGYPHVVVNFTPHSPPIVIPRSGGSFSFTAQLRNEEATALNLDAWINLILPNGAVYGPLFNRNVTVPSGSQVTRVLSQSVPGYAPAGIYTYTGYAGVYPNEVWDSDGFDFTKSGTDAFSGGDWYITGWDGVDFAGVNLPVDYSVSQNYPNPFNPETQISFAIPAPGKVSLKVYNTLGERVAALVDGYLPAGFHHTVFNGEGLSSGIYLYVIQAGDYRAVKKMTLLK